MAVMPVIVRELRASARQVFTYHLRTLGAAALLLTMLTRMVFGVAAPSAAQLGSQLFNSLHFTLLMATWVLVPLLTYDCLSRERREGTLGLLFLTRLRAQDVVIAKSIANGLRALTLWLAVIPVLTIPFLMGGVSWIAAVMSVLIILSSICWALAAGLLGSALNKSRLRALLSTVILAGVFLIIFGALAGRIFWLNAAVARSGIYPELTLTGLFLISGGRGIWEAYLTLGSWSQLMWAAGQLTLVSLLALALAITIAGFKIQRSWQEEAPAAWQLWFQRTFCTPVLWLALFRRWMRRKLERNPVGWLEQRTWTGRLVTWGWFAVIISLYSAVLTDRNFFRNYMAIQGLMAWLLAISLAMSAAGSFRRERETGVLELLLVSPLGENRIISGRLGGLWGQFLPAFGLLLGVWTYFAGIVPAYAQPRAIIFCAVTFFALPVIGLYFSLRCQSVLTAFMATLFVGLVIPMIIPPFLQGLLIGRSPGLHRSPEAALVEILLAVMCWSLLRERLKRRAFPLERPAV